jgi:probable F420-dependent oxidoreductase
MQLGKLGIWSPTDLLTPPELIDLARRSERLGYAALWIPESRGHEPFALSGFLLSHTERLIVATGIANIYARDAVTARLGQHTLAKLSGGRFLLGLGVSHVPLVEGLRGHRYGKPLATMRAYLDAMDTAAAFAPAVPEPPPTVLAALGPHMTALGARRTAGIHPYNVTPEHTAWARGIVGPAAWVCVEQMVLRMREPAPARAVARRNLVPYLAMPNYRNAWLRMGFSEADLAGSGGDRFLDAIVAWGDDAALRRRIQEHFAAGASHVCIQPLHPSGERRPDLDAIEALAPQD